VQDLGLALGELQPELGQGEPKDRQHLLATPAAGRNRDDVVDPPDVPRAGAAQGPVDVNEDRVRQDGGGVRADRKAGHPVIGEAVEE
jgi:hypothetical protein